MKSASRVIGKFKVLIGPNRREGSSQAAADGPPTSSANSRQDRSVEIPRVTESIRDMPLNSIESTTRTFRSGQRSAMGPEDNVPATQERKQSIPNPEPMGDVKALAVHTTPSSDSNPPGLVDSSKTKNNFQTPEITAPVDEKTNEAHISPSLRSKTSTRSSIASRQLPPQSTQSWTKEKYSQKLWNLAYDLLEEENGEVIEQYESVIFTCLRAAEENEQELVLGRLSGIIQSTESTTNAADSKPTSRGLLMSNFLQLFRKSPDPTESCDNSMAGDTNVNVDEPDPDDPLSFMSGLEEAIQRRSYAHIPWVASCFAIESLLRTEQSGHDHAQTSTIFVICSMEYYIGLSNLFFHPEGHPSNVIDKNSQEWALVSLYNAILSHQIQIGLSELGESTSKSFTRDTVDHAALMKCEQEIKNKEKDFMCFNMQSFEGRLTAWLDRATDKSVKASDVDGKSQQSSQQNDVWKTWDVAEQPNIDLDAFASQPFDKLYHWLQETSEFEEFVSWGSEPRGRVLLLDADLGTGKTDLLRVVCMRLSKPQEETTDSTNPGNVVLFVPDSSRPNTNNVAFLLRSLIVRVLEQQPGLNFPDTDNIHLHGPADFYALKMIFYSLLRNEKFLPTYFVICDSMEPSAIDSMDPVTAPTVEQHNATRKLAYEWGLKDLLSMIATTATESDKVRWLVSLNGNEQAASSSEMENSHNPVSITTNIEAVHDILARHSASRVSEIAKRKSQDDCVYTRIYDAMQNSPHLSLLWINTALNIASRDRGYWNAPTIFEGLIANASNMNALYEKAKEDIYKLGENDKKHCLEILSTLAFAYRPLSPSELQDIVELPVEISITILIEEYLPLFLKVSNDKISGKQSIDFVHPSAKDFILEPSNLLPQHELFSTHHVALAARCLRILIDGFETGNIDPSTDDTLKDARVFNEYAIIFWIRHLLQMKVGTEEETTDLVGNLVREFRTQWLETIDLYGMLRDALTMLNDMEDAMEAAAKPRTESTDQIHRIIQEIGEFIRLHLEWTETSQDVGSDDSYSEVTVTNSFVFWPSMRPSWLAQAPNWDTSDYTPKGCLQVMKHPDWVRCCAFSSCGRLVATGADDHSIRLWDISSGTLQHVLGDVGSFAYSVAVSRSGPRGQPLLAACGSKTIKVWNISTGRMIKELNGIEKRGESETERKIEKAVAFEDDRDATCSSDKAEERADEAHERSDTSSTQSRANFMVERIDISPEGDCLVALVNHCLVLWKTSNFESTTLHEMDENEELNSVRFSTDGQHLAAGIGTHILTCDVPTKQWNSREPAELHWLPASPIHYSRSQKAMGEEAEVKAEQEDGRDLDGEGSETSSTLSRPVEIYPGHSKAIYGLCYSPEKESGRLLASGSDDGTARIWNLEECRTEVVLKYHKFDINSVSFSADGLYLATASYDHTIGIWNQVSPGSWGTGVRTQPVQVLVGHSSMICSVSFAPQGYRLVSGGIDSEARVWEIDVESFQPADLILENESEDHISRVVEGPGTTHSHPVICVSVSPDGSTIASGCQGGHICLWDGATGAHRLTMADHHERAVISLVFSDDGETLISTSLDGSAFVWSVKGTTSRAKNSLKGVYDDWVRGAAISLDKRVVATACDDGAVRVWDIPASSALSSNAGDSKSDSVQPRVFRGHGDYVYCVAFSPNGQYLASAGDDGDVMFWALAGEGDKIKADKKAEDDDNHWWRGIVFTQDCDYVLTASDRGVVVMWKPQFESAEKCQRLAVCSEADTFRFTSMRINSDQPKVLITNTGAWEFKISEGEMEQSETKGSSLQLQRRQESLDISGDRRWITWDDKKLILLPLKFRSTRHASSRWVQGRYVVIGCDSGQVLLFKLAEDMTPTVPKTKAAIEHGGAKSASLLSGHRSNRVTEEDRYLLAAVREAPDKGFLVIADAFVN